VQHQQRKTVTTGLAWLSLASGALKLMEFSGDSATVAVRLQQELERICRPKSSRRQRQPVRRIRGHPRQPRAGLAFRRGQRPQGPAGPTGRGHLTGFGADGLGAAFGAAGALLRYAQSTQGRGLQHVRTLTTETESEFIGLDAATRRNLELTETIRGQESPTLFSLLDHCRTAMGSRLLRHWLHHARRDQNVARAPPEAIAALAQAMRRAAGATLAQVPDIERITTRIALLSARPRDLAACATACCNCRPCAARGARTPGRRAAAGRHPRRWHACRLPDCWCAPWLEPAAMVRDGGVIATGFDAELDELRALSENAGQFLLDLETRERARTGIANLRVEYNKVHGFYIEVTTARRTRCRTTTAAARP
jgi:DNA mismatch repair protein MutS